MNCEHISLENAHKEHRSGGITHTCYLCGYDIVTGRLGDYYSTVRECKECYPKIKDIKMKGGSEE